MIRIIRKGFRHSSSQKRFLLIRASDKTGKNQLTLYFILRAFSMVILFSSFPFILSNIGSDSFAKVTILLTLFQFITILDWGLGNFIISRFTAIFQREKVDEESEFATKFIPLLPISSLILVALIFFVDRASVAKLAFSLGKGPEYELKVYLFYLLSFINLILLCLTKILLVMKRRDRYQFILSINAVFPQLILFGVSYFPLSSIDMVLSYQVSSSLVYIVGLLGILDRKYIICGLTSHYKSNFRLDAPYLKFVIYSSYKFFFLQLIGFITSQAGILLVAQFSHTQEVTAYAIIMRILGIHIAFVTFMYGSSQSEINLALRNSRFDLLREYFVSVYLFSLVFITLIFMFLFLFRQDVFFLNLLGGSVLSTQLLLSGLLFIIVWSINFPFSVIAISDFPPNWYFRGAIVSLQLNLFIAVVLLKYLSFSSGPLIANSISMIFFSIVPFIYFNFRKNHHSEENSQHAPIPPCPPQE